MEFELTETQASLRDATREFAAAEVAPQARDIDRDGEMPAGVLDGLADLGLSGLIVDDEYGGEGLGLAELAVAVEELAAVLMGPATVLSGHLAAASLLQRHGDASLRATHLPRLASFDATAAVAVTEAGAGNDRTRTETTARRDGEEWVISGHKQWVSNYPDADLLAVLARTGDAPEALTAFLVPTDDVEHERTWETLGLHSVPVCAVSLPDVRVPASHLLGAEDGGLAAFGSVHASTVNVAARGVGMARATQQAAAEHAREREQFGGPLGSLQGVRFRLAEMASRTDAARLLTLRAATAADAGRETTAVDLSMAKWHASEAAVENASEALQLHGGVGYAGERGVERHLRDAYLLRIAGGANAVHRDRVGEDVLATPE